MLGTTEHWGGKPIRDMKLDHLANVLRGLHRGTWQDGREAKVDRATLKNLEAEFVRCGHRHEFPPIKTKHHDPNRCLGCGFVRDDPQQCRHWWDVSTATCRHCGIAQEIVEQLGAVIPSRCRHEIDVQTQSCRHCGHTAETIHDQAEQIKGRWVRVRGVYHHATAEFSGTMACGLEAACASWPPVEFPSHQTCRGCADALGIRLGIGQARCDQEEIVFVRVDDESEPAWGYEQGETIGQPIETLETKPDPWVQHRYVWHALGEKFALCGQRVRRLADRREFPLGGGRVCRECARQSGITSGAGLVKCERRKIVFVRVDLDGSSHEEPAEEKPPLRTRRVETFHPAGTPNGVFQLQGRIKPGTKPHVILNGDRVSHLDSMWTSPSGEVGFPGEWFDRGDVLEIDYEAITVGEGVVGAPVAIGTPNGSSVPIVGVVNELITPGDEAFIAGETRGTLLVAGGPGIGVDGTASGFANEDFPPSVLVTGGTLSDQDKERLEEYLKNQTGLDRHKILVLESEASKIEIHPGRAPLPAIDPTGTSAQGVERDESNPGRTTRADTRIPPPFQPLPEHGEPLWVRVILSGLRVLIAVTLVSAVALVAVDWLVL